MGEEKIYAMPRMP